MCLLLQQPSREFHCYSLISYEILPVTPLMVSWTLKEPFAVTVRHLGTYYFLSVLPPSTSILQRFATPTQNSL